MSKKSPINPCLIGVSKMPIERFQIATGRKWKASARSLSALLEFIARHANGDGTFVKNGINYSPSQKTMMTKFGFSDEWIDVLLDRLRDLGYLTWTRNNRHDRRLYTINMQAVSDPNYSQSGTPTIQNATPTIQEPDANYSSENGIGTPTIENRDANSRVGTSVFSPSESSVNPPSTATERPTDSGEKSKPRAGNDVVDSLSKAFSKVTLVPFGAGSKKTKARIEEAAESLDNNLLLSAVVEFANGNDNWDEVRCPALLFLSRLSDYVAVAEAQAEEKARRLREEQSIALCIQQHREEGRKRREESERQLAEENALAEKTRHDPFGPQPQMDAAQAGD